MTFLFQGLELGGAALDMEKGSNRILDGTLLLKLGLDSPGV